jgi:hypothetical protein
MNTNLQVTLTVNLSINEVVLRHALAGALAMEMSLEEYFSKALMNGGAQNTEAIEIRAPDWMQIALDRAKAKASGEEFILRGLFSAEEWSKLPMHQVFGRQFRGEIEKADIGHFHKRSVTNKAIYVRH